MSIRRGVRFVGMMGVVVGGLGVVGGAGAQPLGPTPYLSASDSPFSGLSFSAFYLETFEDGALNTPSVSASGGFVAGPGALSDSVDADDGAIDGSGTGGFSWFSGGVASQFTFTFDAAALGGAPTHVGIVWTDVGDVLSGTPGFGDVVFEAFDLGGASLGVISAANLGDGSAAGGTAEDRFFGFAHLGGISRFSIATTNSVDWEVDHLQYGIIPAPGAVLVLVVAGVVGVRRRRG
jgi:hypothetical protein